MMSADVLVNTVDMDHREWLEKRKEGIGGSDVSAILGLNPWKSAFEVYQEKIGAIQPELEAENEEMEWGKRLEPVIADKFREVHGVKLRRRNAILQSRTHYFMLANVDRIIIDPKGRGTGILEIKTGSEYRKQDWKDGVPLYYQCQVAHYLFVTGYKYSYVATLLGGNRYQDYLIEPDQEFIDYIVEEEKKFWFDHVLPEIPPPIDASESTARTLERLYGKPEKGSAVELPSEAVPLLREYKQIKDALDALKKQSDDLKEVQTRIENQLKDMLGNHEIGLIDGQEVVTWKSQTDRFDQTRFRKEHPELYEKYKTKKQKRRFNVKI